MKTSYEILEMALRKEKQAHDFYDGLLTQGKVDAVRQLVEKLRDEEGKHVTMIESMMTQMRLGRSPV